MTVRAGDVYYANLDPAKGTEQKGDRPVLIVNVVSLGPRAIVVPLTTSIRNWATRIRISIHGITSEAMCEQVRTIDVSRLDENLYGRVDGAKLQEVQQTIARLLGVY